MFRDQWEGVYGNNVVFTLSFHGAFAIETSFGRRRSSFAEGPLPTEWRPEKTVSGPGNRAVDKEKPTETEMGSDGIFSSFLPLSAHILWWTPLSFPRRSTVGWTEAG